MTKQSASSTPDHGARSAVTGGKQMSGFSNLISDALTEDGIPASCIFCDKAVELPGFYRGTKKWDLLVVYSGVLIAVVEVKSHIGPSFGNNFNNRVEEAVGSATDIWTAYREGKFGLIVEPWLGYLILVEDCKKSRSPVAVKEPHFEVFPEFKDASYIKRYEIFCSRLMRERLYSRSALLVANIQDAKDGDYAEPSHELSIRQFLHSLTDHARSCVERLKSG